MRLIKYSKYVLCSLQQFIKYIFTEYIFIEYIAPISAEACISDFFDLFIYYSWSYTFLLFINFFCLNICLNLLFKSLLFFYLNLINSKIIDI